MRTLYKETNTIMLEEFQIVRIHNNSLKNEYKRDIQNPELISASIDVNVASKNYIRELFNIKLLMLFDKRSGLRLHSADKFSLTLRHSSLLLLL